MADDKERAKIFRRQTKELVDSEDDPAFSRVRSVYVQYLKGARSIKEALAVFMDDKDVPMLVATLQGVLDTPEKEALFETIGWFIPEHFLADYRAHCPTASCDGSEDDTIDDDGASGVDLDVLAIAAAATNRTASGPTVVRGVAPPALPLLVGDPDSDNAGDDYDDATGYGVSTSESGQEATPTAQPLSFAAAAEQHSVAATDNFPPQALESAFGNTAGKSAPQSTNPFGSDTATSEEAVNPGFYIELDPDADFDDDDDDMIDNTPRADTQLFQDRDPVRPQDITTSMCLEHSPVVVTTGFLVGDISRQEAEDIIIENGVCGGAFLVRKKSNPSEGSFKLRPGQKPAHLSWALSFVQHSLAFSHQLIVQQRPGTVLNIGGKELGRTTRLPDLIEFLRTQAGYELTRSPYQSQPWYHGSISREEAEARLLKTPVPGRFLVRRSLRESRTVVVSIVGQNDRVVHYRATFTGAGWMAQKYPRYLYDTVFDLLIANCGQYGFQLSSHCARPKASGGIRRR